MENVEISPSELRFRFALNKQLLGTITISNQSNSRVAFKVKTTAPKKYVVRPSSGIVEAKGSIIVQVIMQAQKEVPADIQDCKDKFMVQTIAVAPGEDIGTDTFNKDVKKEALKENRLKVILEGPAAPPSPITEETPEVPVAEERPVTREREANAGPNVRAAAISVPDAKDVAALKARLDKLQQERDDLRKTLDQVELQGAGASKSSAEDAKLGFKIGMVHMILVAILAFIIGHYLRA